MYAADVHPSDSAPGSGCGQSSDLAAQQAVGLLPDQRGGADYIDRATSVLVWASVGRKQEFIPFQVWRIGPRSLAGACVHVLAFGER